MAGGVLALVAGVIVLGIIAWVLVSSGVFAKSVQEGEVDVGADEDQRDALVYLVPAGQDPAVVLAALAQHGIEADPATGLDSHVVVPRPHGVVDEAAWREQVREAIDTADTTMIDPEHVPGPVRFADEQTT